MHYQVEFSAPVAAPPASMPALTRSAMGELLCAFSTCWEPFPRGGELQLVRSPDEGRTWSQPLTLWRAPDPRVTINCCVGMATLADGTILLPALYSLVPKKAQPPGAAGGEAGVIALYELGDFARNRRHIHCLRSGDHGQTWTNIAVGGSPVGGGIMRFGRLLELQSGELLLPAYTYFSLGAEAQGAPGYFRSADKGWTWGPFEPVPVGWTSEMNLLELRDGTWLALIRDMPGQEKRRIFGMTRSTDQGRTWEPARPTGVQGKMPDLWEAEDGRLLLMVGCEGNVKGFEIYRKRERRSFNALFISEDGGRSWQRDVQIPPLDEHTQAIPADEPTMVPLGGGRYYVVSQRIDRGEDRDSHPVDWDYYFSLQGTLLVPA